MTAGVTAGSGLTAGIAFFADAKQCVCFCARLDLCILLSNSVRIQKSVRDMSDVSLSFRAAGFLAVPRGKTRIARLLNFEYAIPNFEFSNLKFEI